MMDGACEVGAVRWRAGVIVDVFMIYTSSATTPVWPWKGGAALERAFAFDLSVGDGGDVLDQVDIMWKKLTVVL